MPSGAKGLLASQFAEWIPGENTGSINQSSHGQNESTKTPKPGKSKARTRTTKESKKGRTDEWRQAEHMVSGKNNALCDRRLRV